MQNEVTELKARLAEKEAALTTCAADLAQAEIRVQALSGQFSTAVSQLNSQQEALSAQESQLEAQAATIESAKAAAQQRQETLDHQRHVLMKQGESLAEAAEQMGAMAARIMGRARFDADAKAKQTELKNVEVEAEQKLQNSLKSVVCHADLACPLCPVGLPLVLLSTCE